MVNQKSKLNRPKRFQKKSAQNNNFYYLCLFITVLAIFFYFQQTPTDDEPHTIISNTTESINQFWPSKCKTEDLKALQNCSSFTCKRAIIDDFISEKEIMQLNKIFTKALFFGKGSGGVSIYDFYQNVLSYKDKFISLDEYLKQIPEEATPENEITKEDKQVLWNVSVKVKKEILRNFFADEKENIFLTSPSFFTEIETTNKVKNINDRYWHQHIDESQYPGFVITSLIYLSDFGTEFTGGEFEFVNLDSNSNNNHKIEPKKGRLNLFSSGREHTHFVNKIQSGKRRAITLAFTCDKSKSIEERVQQQIKPELIKDK